MLHTGTVRHHSRMWEEQEAPVCPWMVPAEARMVISGHCSFTHCHLIPVLAHILWMLGLVCLDSLPSSGLCRLIADCAKSKSVSCVFGCKFITPC